MFQVAFPSLRARQRALAPAGASRALKWDEVSGAAFWRRPGCGFAACFRDVT